MFKLLFASALAQEASVASEVVVAQDQTILEKGLTVAGIGIVGVFLVLLLFFITIKLMQNIKNK